MSALPPLGFHTVGMNLSRFLPGSAFDLANPILRPPPFSTTINSNVIQVSAVDPHLRIPFTEQWNAAVERQLGTKQTLSATYVGSAGGRLLREDRLYPPAIVSLGSGSVYTTWNAGDSLTTRYKCTSSGVCRMACRRLCPTASLNQGIWVPRMQEIFARRV